LITNKRRVSVVDHGIGNIRSVTNALEHSGFVVNLTSNPDELRNSDALIFPGVGNFGGVMDALESKGLKEAVKEYISEDLPFVGICVGMQVLLEESTESPNSKGFGFLTGQLRHLSTLESNKTTPSIGWNDLEYRTSSPVEPALTSGYFVHNYFASGVDDTHLISSYSWHGHQIPAHMGLGRVHGVQFHPEKSRIEGLNFLSSLILEVSR
jgi:imidazole glycerol phosphate synthase glutamine amidotransferase subunit